MGPMRAWSRLDWAALALVTFGAAVLRLPGLSRPIGLVFDEIFYARNACRYVIGSVDVCGIDQLASRAHPPLGNWVIGIGVKLFGYEPFGWRVAAAVAGVATVALTYVLARRVLARAASGKAATVGAFAAAGLLATDFLHLVQSRIGMLDVIVTLFVLGAVLAVVVDRDQPRTRESVLARLTLGRPWRLVAGMALGAAAATKWSGGYAVLAVVVLTAYWEVAARLDERGWRDALWRAVREEAPRSVVLLGLVPVLVYLASYTGRMPGELIGLPWRDGTVWRGIWEHQRAMLDFHTALPGDHPYQSPPWSWPLLKRPVAYWFADEGGAYREILAMGNPVAWWPGLVALAGLVVTWWRSGWSVLRPELVILAAAASTYLPWLILSGDRSQTFIWYLLPTIPFLCLALGFFAALAWERIRWRVAAAAYSLVLIASFGFYLPLLVALPISPDAWWSHIPFRDCAGQTVPDDTTSSGEPPPGWCWI
jgi:dolichyl-phosphate-mannose-protein mannosyltransferase